ncbi:hypothetical protein PoB_005100000 [Plakobranchus ocellatus]|uniref:Uncharacterized protein n=1 Tax=Plakobranchus ocellatus TaxID=259542 RepID=A0AAV4BZB4_9GAST|nr:hypothetical protein PoB_005100000 [Plakobranchus ocellatus]
MVELSLRFGISRGAAEDLPTTSFHSSRSSVFRKVFLSSSPVHSPMLSSQRFFCLPLLLPPFMVPCMMVLARQSKSKNKEEDKNIDENNINYATPPPPPLQPHSHHHHHHQQQQQQQPINH